MYIYQMTWPIDYFGLMRNFSELYTKRLNVKRDTEDYEDECWWSAKDMRWFLRCCLRELAEVKSYWEGDIRGNELYVGSIPDPENSSSHYFIALKQDNNGSSFMVPEVPFVHLSEFVITEGYNRPISQVMQNNVKELMNKFAPTEEKESMDVFDEMA